MARNVRRFIRDVIPHFLSACQGNSSGTEPPTARSHQVSDAICSIVRATIDIDDNVFLTVKELAVQQKTTAGRVVSDLLRQSLQPRTFELHYRDDVPLLPRRPRGPVVTSELVARLRDEDE